MATHRRKFVGIKVGDVFHNYEELRTTMERVQRDSQVLLYMRDSITLKGAVKKRPNVAKMANKKLLYHSIQYCCIFGGRYRNKTAQAELMKEGVSCFPESSNEKCNADIKVGLSDDFQLLEVRRIRDCHNHSISKRVFDILGEHRLMSQTPRYRSDEEVVKKKKTSGRSITKPRRYSDTNGKTPAILKKLVAKKNVKKKKTISDTLEPVVIKRKRKSNGGPARQQRKQTKSSDEQRQRDPVHVWIPAAMPREESLKCIVEEMRAVGDATVDVYSDGGGCQAIYFQMADMKKSFIAYPELLLVDASCEIAGLDQTLYVLMNADGNAECVIVCLWLVSKHDKEALTFLIRKFKQHNREWNCIKVLMADRDCCDWDLISSELPQATNFVCYLHAMRCFRKEVSSKKLGVPLTHPRKEKCLDILSKMTEAETHAEYLTLTEEFTSISPPSVQDYFVKHWGMIPELWVHCYRSPCTYYLDMGDNRLDSIVQILLSVCDNFSTPTQFVLDIVDSVLVLRRDRRQRALAHNSNVAPARSNSADALYRKLLTPYAYTFVKHQRTYASKVKIQRNISNTVSQIECQGEDILTGTTFCPCPFFSATGLACSHIFAVRKRRGLHPYDPVLCAERWTLACLQGGFDAETTDTESLDEYSSAVSSSSSLPPDPDETLDALMEVAPFIPTCIVPGEEVSNIEVDGSAEDASHTVANGFTSDKRMPMNSVPRSSRSRRKRGSSPDINWIALQEVL